MLNVADLMLGAALLVAFSQPAQAYLDPNTGSMIVQACLGGFAGLAVLMRVAWKHVAERFRRLFRFRRG